MENKNEYREFAKLDELRKKCPPEEWCWFSFDTTTSGHKSFFAIHKEALIKHNFLENKHVYEIIPAEKPLRPYFDLEMDDVDDHAGKLELFLSYLKTIFQSEFSLVPEYHILDSCRENKLSYHVVLTNCHFASMAELKSFILWLYEDAMTNLKDLHWRYGTETRIIFDKIPYGSSQNVRMVHQSKRGKPYILKCMADPIDTMICKPSGLLLQAKKYKITKTIQPKAVASPELNEKETIYCEEYLEYYKYNLLHPKALKGNWEDWRNMGFALYNTFGAKGIELFVLFSKINVGKYNEKTTTDFYTKLQVGGSKKITFNTIRMWAKQADAKLFKRIFSIYIDKLEERVYCDTDDQASDAILLMLEGKLLFVNRVYYKYDNVWIADTEKIKAILTNYIMSAPLFKDVEGKISQPWANYSNADKIYKTLLNKVQEYPCEKDKFHSTTKYRLCFKNGVLDLRKKRFYTWDQVDFEYYTVVQIPYDYEPSTQSGVVMEVLQPLFGDDLPKALKYLARSLAGCVEDKNFATYLGNRNCGKGALASLLEAFGAYVRPFLLSVVCCQRERSKEDAKELYWLIDFEYVRLALSQEVPKDTKLKGELIKKICSGGDTHTARRNYDRVDTLFQVECSLLMMGNDPIESTGDVNEHRISFEGAIEFKSAEFIEEMSQVLPPEAMVKYRVGDPTIKDKCVTREWWLAMVQIILDHYTDTPLTVVVQETRPPSLIEMFILEYEWTKNESDMVLGAELDHFGPKIKAELKQLGVIYKKCQNRKTDFYNKWVFVGVKRREPTDQ
jgi:hypothetical protein